MLIVTGTVAQVMTGIAPTMTKKEVEIPQQAEQREVPVVHSHIHIQ